MTNHENNVVSKLYRLEKFLIKYSVLLSVYIAITNTANKFIANIVKIRELIGSLNLDQTGTAKQKEQYRDQYEKFLMFLCSPGSVYFLQKDDLITYNKINFEKSHLSEMTENDLLSLGDEVFDIINPEIIPLDDYGLKPINVQNMITAQANFSSLLQMPHTNISEHSADLERLKILIKETNLMERKQLTPLMKAISTTHIKEYKLWLKIKKIIDLGHSEKEGVEFTFEDEISKEKVADVTVNMPNEYFENIHIGNNKGICYFHVYGQDELYTFTATSATHQTYTGTVKVDENHLTKLVVFLVKK